MRAELLLQTIDDSDFNIVISNTRKLCQKKEGKEDKPTDVYLEATPSSLMSTATMMIAMCGMMQRLWITSVLKNCVVYLSWVCM